MYIILSPGRFHDVQAELCSCEPIPVTLRRLGLWSATPKDPRLILDYDSLKFMKSLEMESELTSMAWFNAMSNRTRFNSGKVVTRH